MSQIDLVVKRSRRIEGLLRDHYHAEGKGLHQLISSCEDRIPNHLIPKLRFIATIRNKTVHEDGYKLKEKSAFVKTCQMCEKELMPRSGRFIWGVVWTLIIALIFISLGFYAYHWPRIHLVT